MLEIISEMILCLVLALLIGFVIGYLFAKSLYKKKELKVFEEERDELKPIMLNDEKIKKIEELEEWNEEWEIEETRNYNPHIYKPYEYNLSLYISPSNNKTYLNFDSAIEKEFIEFLEQNEDKILWWWQNGNEHMRSNFGIKYLDNIEEPHTFQPDFLVMFKDGRLGIFDTKTRC